jgi:hypothetical protein
VALLAGSSGILGGFFVVAVILGTVWLTVISQTLTFGACGAFCG